MNGIYVNSSNKRKRSMRTCQKSKILKTTTSLEGTYVKVVLVVENERTSDDAYIQPMRAPEAIMESIRPSLCLRRLIERKSRNSISIRRTAASRALNISNIPM